jgi:hypothetical protein
VVDNPQGWLFMVALATLNPIRHLCPSWAEQPSSALLPRDLVNAIVLIYGLLPAPKKRSACLDRFPSLFERAGLV